MPRVGDVPRQSALPPLSGADARPALSCSSRSSRTQCPVAALIASNPYATYARIAALLHPAPRGSGRHARERRRAIRRPRSIRSACDRAACRDRSAVRDRCARASIGPGCVVLRRRARSAPTRASSRTSRLCRGVAIGERCLVHPGVVIGADGFGFAPDAASWVKVPQVGTRAHRQRRRDRRQHHDRSRRDRGHGDRATASSSTTRSRSGTTCASARTRRLPACTGVSGSTTIGKRCMIGGQVGIAGHLTICDDVVVTGQLVRHPAASTSRATIPSGTAGRRSGAIPQECRALPPARRTGAQVRRLRERDAGA